MDKKYLKDNNLLEAVRRFNQINEYIVDRGVTEAQDASAMPQQGGMGNPGQQQGMAQQPPMGANDGAMPQQPQQGMPQDGMGGDDMQMGGEELDPTIGADADIDNGMGDDGMGGAELGGFDGGTPDDMGMGGEQDEVIDVDDLTQSQESSEYKIDGVDDKLSKLMDIVSKFAEAIDDNNKKVEDLRKDMEERNPTQQERLNIRSMSGSPYNVTPQDYWTSQNAKNPQYNVVSDNDVDPDKEDDLFTISKNDIKNFNKDEIEKSISNIPDNLKDYF